MKIIYDEAVMYNLGVYRINLDNKHEYIGKTKRSFKKRWDEHLWSFNNGSCNKKFRKHLKPNSTLSFEAIRLCRNDREAKKWEKYYINELQPDLNVKMK